MEEYVRNKWTDYNYFLYLEPYLVLKKITTKNDSHNVCIYKIILMGYLYCDWFTNL